MEIKDKEMQDNSTDQNNKDDIIDSPKDNAEMPKSADASLNGNSNGSTDDIGQENDTT